MKTGILWILCWSGTLMIHRQTETDRCNTIFDSVFDKLQICYVTAQPEKIKASQPFTPSQPLAPASPLQYCGGWLETDNCGAEIQQYRSQNFRKRAKFQSWVPRDWTGSKTHARSFVLHSGSFVSPAVPLITGSFTCHPAYSLYIWSLKLYLITTYPVASGEAGKWEHMGNKRFGSLKTFW